MSVKKILESLHEKMVDSSNSEYNIDKESGNHYTLTKVSDGKVYHVDKNGHNWQCDCPAFKFRGGKTCKHIQLLLDMGEIKPEKVRQPIEKMEPMKQVIEPIISKYDPNWEIVGSYRRGKDTFKDVDILVNCSEEDFIKLRNELMSLPNYTSTINGTELIRGLYKEGDLDIDLDINRVYTDAPAAMLLYRTGPADLNMFMRKRAMSKGWSLSEKGIIDHITGEKVNVPQSTEEEIFNSLDLQYLTPQEREHWQDVYSHYDYDSQIKIDMRDIYYGPKSIVPKLAELIREHKDDILNGIESSKSRSKRDAMIYRVMPYAKTLAKYPYSGECVAAFKLATGIEYN